MESKLDFHFNEWCFLARIDPDAFECRRLRLIEDFLSRSGHHRPRLEALQASIDKERDEAGSTAETLLMLSRKMCGALWLLKEELKELSADLHQMKLPSCAKQSTWSLSITRRRYARPTRRRQEIRSH
ncbi:MAG TPA: DUF3135 domain-containing protein [Rhodocyclaceae bacterium]|nr:DUF3135 domain-containing protein [Rhodocyclaceae bacterium]